MTAHGERRTIPGLSRRSVLRAGLLAGAGLAAAGAASAALTGTARAAGDQSTWAWCGYCQGMWYAGFVYSQPSQLNSNRNLGVCPENGTGGHLLTNDSSFNYLLGYNLGNTGSQPQGGWLWCGACMGLYTSLHSASVCPAGGTHLNGGGPLDPNGTSDDYYLYHDQPVTSNPQAYWRWCDLCQGLYFQGNNSNQTNGICPYYGVGGGRHQMGNGSYNYEIAYNGSLGLPVLD
jgi:hypothetical protein